MVQKAPAGLHFNKEIDVTFFVCFPPGNRPEEPDVAGSMFGGDLEDLLPFLD
jgi:hypothetical protein